MISGCGNTLTAIIEEGRLVMEALNENVAVDAKDVVGAKVVCAYCMTRALEGGKHACILRAK